MSMSLLDAFRTCASLRFVPNVDEDHAGAAKAESENKVRLAAARALVEELDLLSRRAIRPGAGWLQQDCAAGAVSEAYIKICPKVPRGLRTCDPATDGAVRAYLREVLRNAFLDCVRVRRQRPGVGGDREEVSDDLSDDDALSFDTDPSFPERATEAVDQIISAMPEDGRRYVEESVQRRQAELRVGREVGSLASVDALRNMWNKHIRAHANPDELSALEIALTSNEWCLQFVKLGESLRGPQQRRVYCDDPPKPVDILQKTVMNRMAKRQGRALAEGLDAAIEWIRSKGLDYDQSRCVLQELHSRVAGRKGSIANAVVKSSRTGKTARAARVSGKGL